MSHLLVLNSTPSGAASVSGILVQEVIDRYRDLDPATVVTVRDLDADPLPHLTSKIIAGVRGQPVTETELAAREVSDALIAELLAADVVVIGAPMHNFSVPTALRAWFDHVLRPGVTFGYSEAGPKGLVEGKKAILALATGGLYSEGPTKLLDHQEPYLRQLLGFMGVTDVAVVRAEKIGFGPEAREAAIDGARADIARLVGHRRAA
jgi:FMN-dependent NADH-azoreductase